MFTDVFTDVFTDMSTAVLEFANSAVAYGVANNAVAEGANNGVAYRVDNITLAYGAANSTVAYRVVNMAVSYAGTSFIVLMHMGLNYVEADAAMNVTKVYHGMQLPSGMPLKVAMKAGTQ